MPEHPVTSRAAWRDGYFGRGYYALYRHYLIPAEQSAAEAKFLMKTLKPRPGERWLDVPCGYGRHLTQLRRLKDEVRFYGIDLNREYLREPGLSESPAGGLACGDMRALPFPDASFHAVLNLLNSFGYHPPAARGEASGDARALAEFARVLKKRGLLAMDLPDRRGLLSLVKTHPRIRYCADNYEVVENFEWDARAECLLNWTRWVWPEGSEKAHYRLRLYTPGQIEKMAARAGLGIENIYGDFRGGEYISGKSERMLFIFRRDA